MPTPMTATSYRWMVIPSAPVRRIIGGDMKPATVAVTGLIALAVAIGIGRFAFTPILPMMQDDAGVSVVDGGWLAAANYVGYLVGALSIVWLRIPAAVAIRAGLLTIAAATVGM